MKSALKTRWLAAWLMIALSAAGQAQRTVQEQLGYPASARLLIIHGDDLGMLHTVNRATFEALEKGWITSASILIPCPWLPEVATWSKAHPDADLGLHLALTSEWTTTRWGPVAPQGKVPTLIDAQGYLPLTEDAAARNARPGDAEIEVEAQIARARFLGIHFTHFDPHMGALMQTPALFRIYESMGREHNVPIRVAKTDEVRVIIPGEALLDGKLEITPGVAPKDWLEAYKKMLAPLKPGVYHLTVHLAFDDDEMRGATADHPDWGAAWRQSDFDLVRSAEFRRFLRDQGFVLVTWKQLAKALPRGYHVTRQ